MEENIFKKAKLTSTRFKENDEIVPQRASGYVEQDKILRTGEPHRPAILAPNGGILSTVRDLSQWAAYTLTPGFLSAASLESMNTQVVLNDGTRFRYGIGWFLRTVNGHRVLLHNGSTVAGFSSVIYHHVEPDCTIIVLMNIDRGDAVNRLATALADSVLK